MKLLVTSVRNEAPNIAEWIAWHKMIGYDHFLVYTNDNTDNTKDILEKISRLGFLTWVEQFPKPDDFPQMIAFDRAMEWIHEHKPDWISVFDSDEFLNLKVDMNLDEFVARYPKADAIAINWKLFGSSEITHKGLGLTPERFLWAAYDDYFEHRQFKSLVRYNKDLVRIFHRAVYKDDFYANINYVFPDGRHVHKDFVRPGPFNTAGGLYHYDFSIAQLNHYAIRSLAEYKMKRMRGSGIRKSSIEDASDKIRDENYRRRFDKNIVFDNSILRRLDEYVQCYLELCQQVDIPTYIGV